MIMKLSEYLREKYKAKARKIPIDPHIPCPHVCSYCDGKGSFMPEYSYKSIKEQVIEGTKNLKRKCPQCKTIVYFQSSTITNTSPEKLKDFLIKGMEYSQDAIIMDIATRPDCIDVEKLNVIKEVSEIYNVDVFLELGLQTMHNKTLERIKRGHTYEDFLNTLELTKDYNFHIITHLILSLPGETKEMMIETIEKAGNNPLVHGIKFHMLYILKNSQLGREYKEKPFRLLTKEEYYNIIEEGLKRIKKDIVIHRMISSAPKYKILAPDWL